MTVDRPGDKQPPYRALELSRCRQALAASLQFERSMRAVQRAVDATPENLRALERAMLSLAKR